MAEFDLLKVKIIDRFFSIGVRYIAHQNRFSSSAVPVPKSVQSYKKKHKPLLVGVARSPKIFPKPNFSRLYRSMA